MKCPGQDSRYWKPGAIFEVKCPKCGKEVEFFKDDTTRKCGSCGHKFVNPKMDFGCAAYCPFAEQCIGDLPPEVAAQQENLLKDKVAVAVKQYYGRDFRRIGHTSRVARYAEQLARAENANLAVVLAAAFLLDVDQAGPSQTPGDKDGTGRGNGGTAVARAILDRVHARQDMTDAVCDVIQQVRGGNGDASREVGVVRDAMLLAGLEEQKRDGNLQADSLSRMSTACHTAACQQQAETLLNV